jgi:hypothetical protein
MWKCRVGGTTVRTLRSGYDVHGVMSTPKTKGMPASRVTNWFVEKVHTDRAKKFCIYLHYEGCESVQAKDRSFEEPESISC